MNPSPCSGFEPLLERWADGEAAADESLRVREHLSECPACRLALRAATELHRRIAQSPAPAPPPDLEDRIHRALADRPRRRAWIPVLAAAAILAAALLLLRPARLPAFVAAGAAVHDAYLSGAAVDPPAVYRHGGTPVSMIVAEMKGGLPQASFRSRAGRPYHVFHAGDNTVLACPKGHVWISRLPEEELAACALDTREELSGEKIPIAGLICRACCATAESRVKKIDGVTDARVNLGSMELVVAERSGSTWIASFEN